MIGSMRRVHVVGRLESLDQEILEVDGTNQQILKRLDGRAAGQP